MLRALARDVSLSALVAGVVTVVVGFMFIRDRKDVDLNT